MGNKNAPLVITIIIGSLIIAIAIYMSQIKKQESIERQQKMELRQREQFKERELEQQKAMEEERVQKEKQDELFNKNLKCQDLLKDLKKRWNNVVGIYYSEDRNACIVKYLRHGEVFEAAIEDMQDVR